MSNNLYHPRKPRSNSVIGAEYSLSADVHWGSFVTHSRGRNECVTNEPQRTFAGRLGRIFLSGIFLDEVYTLKISHLAFRNQLISRQISLHWVSEPVRLLQFGAMYMQSYVRYVLDG